MSAINADLSLTGMAIPNADASLAALHRYRA